MWHKYVELGHKKYAKNIKNFHKILKPSKVAVYAEICDMHTDAKYVNNAAITFA